MADGVLVHNADIPSRAIEQVAFIIPTPQMDDLRHRSEDRPMKLPSLGSAEAVDRMPGMKPRLEENVLANGIPEAGDQLVLSQEALQTPLALLRDIVDQI